MARRSLRTLQQEALPSMVATTLSPPAQPANPPAYTTLVSEGKIGIDDDKVSSGETPVILNLLLMGA